MMPHGTVMSEKCPRVQNRIALAAAFTSFALIDVIIATFLPGILNDADTFLNISVGRWILQNGSFPVADMFSYTKLGETSRATDWIAEVIFAIAYRIGHWRGVTE